MVQSINKIHPENTLITTHDESVYFYNESHVWAKSDYVYHKLFDTKPSSVDVTKYNNWDYFYFYDTISNDVKFSEKFDSTVSYWNRTNISTEYSDVKFANTNRNSTLISTVLGSTEKDYSLDQVFYSKPGKLMVLSTYVKPLSGSVSRCAFTLFNETYNLGISGKFDLYGGSQQVIPVYIDRDYNVVDSATNPFINAISNVHVGITKITENEQTYFRLYITASVECVSQCKIKLNLLDNSNNYKFKSLYRQLYVNGFQIEYLSDLTVTTPSSYITTKDANKKTYRDFVGTYQKQPDATQLVSLPLNKIHYIDDVVESHSNDLIIAKEFTPEITNPTVGDLMVVQSVISFTTYKTSNKKTYEDTIGVKLGSSTISSDPAYVMYFDDDKNTYRIKFTDGTKNLIYDNSEKNKKAMTEAMIYNQGYFETWSRQGRKVFKHGLNTGGGFNFWKYNKRGIR